MWRYREKSQTNRSTTPSNNSFRWFLLDRLYYTVLLSSPRWFLNVLSHSYLCGVVPYTQCKCTFNDCLVVVLIAGCFYKVLGTIVYWYSRWPTLIVVNMIVHSQLFCEWLCVCLEPVNWHLEVWDIEYSIQHTTQIFHSNWHEYILYFMDFISSL